MARMELKALVKVKGSQIKRAAEVVAAQRENAENWKPGPFDKAIELSAASSSAGESLEVPRQLADYIQTLAPQTDEELAAEERAAAIERAKAEALAKAEAGANGDAAAPTEAEAEAAAAVEQMSDAELEQLAAENE